MRASPSDWTAPVPVGANVSVFVFTGNQTHSKHGTYIYPLFSLESSYRGLGVFDLYIWVGTNVSVFVFTGAAETEALVNGVSLGRRSVSPLGFTAFGAVPFAPGNLTAVAYDRR